jgi:hypothetical protein
MHEKETIMQNKATVEKTETIVMIQKKKNKKSR